MERAEISKPGSPPTRSSPPAPARPGVAALTPLYVVIFAGFVGYSLMITVFTPMLLRGDGGMLPADTPMAHRTIVLGILLCLYPLGQFFGSPIMGAFSDRFGRKPILLISLSITTTCYAAIAYALMIRSFALLAVTSLIAGLAEANIVTAQSAIADVVEPAERNRFFGYIYMSVSAAYIVGPLVGGKLADPQIVPWFNYATPFWAVFVLLVLTALSTAAIYHETRTPGVGTDVSYSEAFTNLIGVFTNRRLRSLYWINFLIYLAIFGFFRCYPMYLVDQFHLGVSRVSEFIAWVGVPIVLANLWLTGFFSAHFTVKTLTLWSAILTGVFMVIVVIPPERGSLWVTLFLTSGALALCLPSCATLLSVAAGEDDQGRVMGNNQALQVGAEALSGLVGGLLAAIFVKLSLFVVGAIALIAGALVAGAVRPAETDQRIAPH
ncbi:MAG TPA: MFS transporter [Candidatus Binataceae bacterium]|nr:MFS transporter [Candidatus Binataceae bacterium]